MALLDRKEYIIKCAIEKVQSRFPTVRAYQEKNVFSGGTEITFRDKASDLNYRVHIDDMISDDGLEHYLGTHIRKYMEELAKPRARPYVPIKKRKQDYSRIPEFGIF